MKKLSDEAKAFIFMLCEMAFIVGLIMLNGGISE